MALRSFLTLAKSKHWKTIENNVWGYGTASNIRNEEEVRKSHLPFIDYVLEDKSIYPFANTCLNRKLNKNWVDDDNDFRIGKSGGLLMDMDFIFVNTHIFTRVADYHIKHGRYCPYDDDSENATIFWRKETERRRKGVEAKCKVYFKDTEEYFNSKTSLERKRELIHLVRITGDHYNYINYGRIGRTPSDEERANLLKEGRFQIETIPGFPRFWDADYWYFKTDEFVIKNKKNLCLAKARRKGVSYKRGNQAANRVNMNKAVTVVLAADILDYLTDPDTTADMAKKNLDWYETQTYWKRGFLSESLDNIELGYKKKKDGNKKYGFRSNIVSVAIGRNTSAAIGKKGTIIDFEEAGKSPNLQAAWNVTLSNMESGAIKIGTGSIYGTAGTKNANWAAFSNIFYNCSANNMVEFENIWNYNARHKTCGFFIGQVWSCEPYIYDGNSLFFDAWKYDRDDKIEQRSHQAPDDYVIYCAQRANSPAEAFIDTRDNLFTSPILNDHIQWLMDSPESAYYTDGWYKEEKNETTGELEVRFLNKNQCITEDVFGTGGFHDYIVDVPHNHNTDIHGCVREHFAPFRVDGKIPDDLYFATADTYRIDKDKEQVTVKNSLYSVQIWMRANKHTPYAGKRLIAEYCGRLDTMSQNDRVALDMCIRYNCGILPEAGTGEIISNFKVWQYRHKLMLDPTSMIERSVRNSTNTAYGVVIGDGEKKLEGLRELKDFVYEVVGKTENNTKIHRLNHINSVAFCLELQRYSLTGNFDRVSSAIVAMFEFKKDYILLKESMETNSKRTTHKSLKDRLKRKSTTR